MPHFANCRPARLGGHHAGPSTRVVLLAFSLRTTGCVNGVSSQLRRGVDRCGRSCADDRVCEQRLFTARVYESRCGRACG